MHERRYETRLAAPAAEVFAFLRRPAEVVTVTDPDAGVRLLGGPEVMAVGTANELEVVGFGLPQRVTYTVTALEDRGEAGGAFTESMTRGPMATFENEHEVTADGAGCVVREGFRFAPPGGLLGFVLTAEKIGRELDAAMTYRHRALADRFGSPGGAAGSVD